MRQWQPERASATRSEITYERQLATRGGNESVTSSYRSDQSCLRSTHAICHMPM